MNKLSSWVKAHKFLTALIVIIVLPFIFIYKPYKPTNPSNPLFVESWFRLSDYGMFREHALKRDLKTLFPVGTSMEYVDRMLVDRGGAEKSDETSTGFCYYRYRYKPMYLIMTPEDWWIDVYCDHNKKIEVLMFNRAVINGDWNPRKYSRVTKD